MLEEDKSPVYYSRGTLEHPDESFALPIRVLVIDDDEDDFKLIHDFILGIPQQKFQVDWCPNYKKGSSALCHFTHDIYFIDYLLGIKTGIDLLKEAVENECLEPIILLTGQGNQKVDLEAMRLGASDYLIKSQLTSEQLDRCIRYSLERAATLKESKASERQFRSIFERSKDMIFIADRLLNFKNLNEAASDLLQYSPGELLHLNFAQLFANAADKKEILIRLDEQGEVIDFKIDLVGKDHISKSCLLSASLENDPAGNNYIQGIVHDISVLNRVEEIKLQSEKLEAKGMVIRTLAHEIRNPLHNIILSTGYLKSETTIENQEFLNVIERNSKRINELINELMDSNQYYKMKLEVMPLQVVMNEAIEKALDRIHLSKVKLNFSYPTSGALALLDNEKMNTAFLNIIVNAIEAMENGKGELTITISTKASFHSVQIRDNGCGMSPEDTSRLFEPYFTTKPKGMGLGLAATHAILQSHKAEINVSSALKQGTTFTITFPSL
jgi:PAS domain S-box-containing protein